MHPNLRNQDDQGFHVNTTYHDFQRDCVLPSYLLIENVYLHRWVMLTYISNFIHKHSLSCMAFTAAFPPSCAEDPSSLTLGPLEISRYNKKELGNGISLQRLCTRIPSIFAQMMSNGAMFCILIDSKVVLS